MVDDTAIEPQRALFSHVFQCPIEELSIVLNLKRAAHCLCNYRVGVYDELWSINTTTSTGGILDVSQASIYQNDAEDIICLSQVSRTPFLDPAYLSSFTLHALSKKHVMVDVVNMNIDMKLHLITLTLFELSAIVLQTAQSFLPPTQLVAPHHRLLRPTAEHTPINLKMATGVESIRSELLEIIGKNPEGHKDEAVRSAFATKLQEYSNAEGSDPNDVIFAIGKTVFGVDLPDAKKAKTNGSKPAAAEELPIVDFEYMKEFMKEVFLSYGVTPERAEICSDVLIEADKRGIDSHGLGRLKPIYCDRMDDGILWPEKPIDIITESETTALVDGNLGLGLYIGPHCMQMAIDKAKKFGVGFVACRNSTHYGIAGYYATMATDQGCIGFTGTNARPSIAPTFGVEPMMVSIYVPLVQLFM